MTTETEKLRLQYNPDGSDLRKVQLKLLNILIVVTDICDKHNLPYWISGGTLLGAKRHGGFIPWDDDIDIELMRSDYLKLLKVLSNELPDNLYLQKPREKSYRLLFSKVRDKHTRVHSEEEDMASYKEKGISIDIFTEERSYPWLKSVVDFLYGRAFRRIKRAKPFKSFKYVCEYIVSLPLIVLGWALMWIARGVCAVAKPKYILHSYGIGNTTNHKAEYMFPTSKIEFEGKMFSAPKNVNAYLTAQYGNYMQIPSEDKREYHLTEVTFF